MAIKTSKKDYSERLSFSGRKLPSVVLDALLGKWSTREKTQHGNILELNAIHLAFLSFTRSISSFIPDKQYDS